MKRVMKLFLAAAAVVMGMTVSAQAIVFSPVFYSDEAAFNAAVTAASASVETETFDSDFSSGQFVRFENFSVSSNALISSSTSSNLCPSGRCMETTTGARPVNVGFILPQNTHVFGVTVGDLGTVGSTYVTLATQFGNASMRWYVPHSSRGTDRFFGVIDATGRIENVTFSNTRHTNS